VASPDFGNAKLVVVAAHRGPLTEAAAIVLPATSWAEHTGTYVNAKGMRQTSEQALRPQGSSKPAYLQLVDLARALGYEPAWTKLGQIRAELARGAGPAEAKSAAVVA
jgi:NADH-quinone oxidoreductase subunit G